MNTNDSTTNPSLFALGLLGAVAGADIVIDGASRAVLCVTEKARTFAKGYGLTKTTATDSEGVKDFGIAAIEAGLAVLGIAPDGEPSWLTYEGKGGPSKAPEGATRD